MDRALAELKDRLGQLTDLRRTEGLLVWDMTVFMPPGGAPTRAAQLATLEGIIHERVVDDCFGELFAELEPYAATLPHDSDDAALVRVAQRDWDRARRVPKRLAVEFAEVSAQSYEAWVKAREESDFAAFRPWLERILDLRRRYVECFAPYDDPYDVLLQDYEWGMRTEEIREIFAVLAPELRELVAAHASEDDDAFMRGPFPIAQQEALSRELVERFGATWDQFRLDTTVHPFEITFGLGDVRLTSRYAEDDLLSLFTAMHECGHGLYEWGISPTLERTPLCAGVSATLHESQSRLWENVVGRSLPFWEWFYPRVQETFPNQLGNVSLEDFHRAVNRVRRSHIRVDADETSYGLHVILRFELEQRLLSGELEVRDLPDAWNARFEELVGIPVPNGRARRPAGRALVGRGIRLLPHVPARHRALRPDLGEGTRGAPRRRGADPPGRVPASARVAPREHLRPREQVHARRDRGTRRRRADRPAAVPRLPARQVRSGHSRLGAALRAQAARPKRFSALALAREASTSRSRGGAFVTSSSSRRLVIAATSSTARSKAGSLALDGFCEPLTLRTYWSAAPRTSSSVAGGSKLWSVLMFLHMAFSPSSLWSGRARRAPDAGP